MELRLLWSCILRACMNPPPPKPVGPHWSSDQVAYWKRRANPMLPAPTRWQPCSQYKPHAFFRRHQPAAATRAGSRDDEDALCFDCEDKEVAHASFLKAHRHSRPENVQIEGMQDFAAAIWERRRSIPSAGDPLHKIFETFDRDHDGRLDASDVAAALRSRNVKITEEQAQLFIEAADIDSNHTVERNEFKGLITHMASADLWSRQLTEVAARSASESESEEESEEEVAQNEILQSIAQESYEEVVTKQKLVQ